MFPEICHCVPDADVNSVGQLGHKGEGLDVAYGDAAGTCPQDATDECGVLGVLDYGPRPV